MVYLHMRVHICMPMCGHERTKVGIKCSALSGLLSQDRSSTEPGVRVGGQQAPMLLLSLPDSRCWGHKRQKKVHGYT